MLSVEDAKIQDRKLILWARFHPSFSRSVMIPEIEADSMQYQVDSQLMEHFQKSKFAENSLYFLHSYAYADIPVGQKYQLIMRISDGKIVPDSVMECETTVLCFFSAFKMLPVPYAGHGHHASCLVQFHGGIPDMIKELYEITEKKPIEIKQEIVLCSYETYRASIPSCKRPLFL